MDNMKHYLVGPLSIWCYARERSNGTISLWVFVKEVDLKGITGLFDLLCDDLGPAWGAKIVEDVPGCEFLPPGCYRYRVKQTGHTDPEWAFAWFDYRWVDMLASQFQTIWGEMSVEEPEPDPNVAGLKYGLVDATGAAIDEINSDLDRLEHKLSKQAEIRRKASALCTSYLLSWFAKNSMLSLQDRREYPRNVKK